MLGSVQESDGQDRWPLRPGSFGAYVVTNDPDALHARAVAAGAEITDPLHETDYGSRDFAARDPEAVRWFAGCVLSALNATRISLTCQRKNQIDCPA